MSQRQQVIRFFQKACQDRELQNRLKPPCPPNRQGFVTVAREWGYNVQGEDFDEYVKFYQFYEEFQTAIARHQEGQEHLATWLNKWEKHLKKIEQTPLDDRRDTIKRFL
jgi:Nif11 domain